ncbi:1,5-anhydro-D-fructose reductase-like [Toxorhynchites rutilus septentrionalis]|uniref:1,5-anhydro-D-fructose reductase-like n=1 Tax=Toxorhynchites rutilus septentrionalis TaxID=329112 RepID=UPI002479A226|nr:1,5-anhydro-D-fructose reductase-like [Toxorhynchites rutilus septentrionalis]
MWARVPRVKFFNGFEIPLIGLGTYLTSGEQGVRSIKEAIDIGYRHIDTAHQYGNECEVGRAVKDKIDEGFVRREDLFITTKLWNTFHKPEHVSQAFGRSLARLQLDYVDLYLMHMPMALGFRGYEQQDLISYDNSGKIVCSDVDYCDTWKAMEQLVCSGRVRSIGLSNFNQPQLERLLSVASIKPVTNQVECNPGFTQRPLIEFCRGLDITVTAFSPMGRANRCDSSCHVTAGVLTDARVAAIGAKYGKSNAQIVLRYLIDIGTTPIPKPSNRAETLENIDIFDFELTAEEIALLGRFDTGERAVPLKYYSHHREYPFREDFTLGSRVLRQIVR